MAKWIKKKRPILSPAIIEHPAYDEENNTIWYPPTKVGAFDLKLEIEIDVFLMEHGYSWQEVRKRRNLPKSWTKKAIYAYYNKYIKGNSTDVDELFKIEKPSIAFYKIDHPEYDKENNLIKCPLVRIEPYDIKLEVEIDVMLMEHGYSWSEVKERRQLPHNWTKKAVYAYYNKYIRRSEQCQKKQQAY